MSPGFMLASARACLTGGSVSLDEVGDEVLELGPREGDDQVLGPGGIGADERAG